MRPPDTSKRFGMGSGVTHYLDFAATSAVRPPQVAEAVHHYLTTCGATPGRGGYGRAVEAGRMVLETRRIVAGLLGRTGDPGRLTFGQHATQAINTALFGLLQPGDALVVTDFDHNAVLRPAALLAERRDIRVRHVHGEADGTLNRAAFEGALDGARLVTINAVSNVLGTALPVAELVDLAHAAGALTLVDSAQSAGHVPVDYGEADLIAFTGHKGLLGPQGVGGLWVRPGIELTPLIAGGTGGRSLEREMPQAYPDRLESGTINGPGVAGLGAGAAWVQQRGVAALHRSLTGLKTRLREGLSAVSGLEVLSPPAVDGSAIVTVRPRGMDSAELARALDRDYGVEVRAGLHCAPEVHRLLGSTGTGAVRFSLGWSSTEDDIDTAVRAVDSVLRPVSVST